jgi:hypothetical protein
MARTWNVIDIIIIGAAGTVLGGIITNKFFTSSSSVIGGGQPKQLAQRNYTARGGVLAPYVPCRTPPQSAPVVQNTPITEAAYNQQPTPYAPTLGPEENNSNSSFVLPI